MQNTTTVYALLKTMWKSVQLSVMVNPDDYNLSCLRFYSIKFFLINPSNPISIQPTDGNNFLFDDMFGKGGLLQDDISMVLLSPYFIPGDLFLMIGSTAVEKILSSVLFPEEKVELDKLPTNILKP